jgi:hypothetical protein
MRSFTRNSGRHGAMRKRGGGEPVWKFCNSYYVAVIFAL